MITTRTGVVIGVLSLFIHTGCAISPERIAKMNDKALCDSYGASANNTLLKQNIGLIRSEIDQRNLISPTEWDLVEQHKIKIGMSVCALRASFGPATENKTVGRYGVHIQHVYRCEMCRHYTKAFYVYTQNGRITSWQD